MLIVGMSDPADLPAPLKLYTQLIECSSASTRATATLEFLRKCASAEAGFLFLVRGNQLRLAAKLGQDDPSPDLITEVKRVWNRELDKQPDDTSAKTLELNLVETLRQTDGPTWRSPDRETFERRILSVYRGAEWVPVGLAMLRVRDGKPMLPIRQVHLEALCNALLDAGDVPGLATPKA
jgi:hypothetical protein